MIQHVPFEALSEQHLEWIAESVLAPPAEVRVESADFLRALMQETMRCFAWEDGCLIVGKRDRRLILFGFACHNFIKRLPAIAEDLRRLAADWECDKIETTCFDRRITSAIKKLGAVLESETLVLAVE